MRLPPLPPLPAAEVTRRIEACREILAELDEVPPARRDAAWALLTGRAARLLRDLLDLPVQ